MRLNPIDGAAADAVREALPAALEGRYPIGLGMTPDAAAAVPEGTAAVIATSGSSGIPKRVVLSAAALRASADATAARIGAGRWLLALPAVYVAGLQVLVRSHQAGTDPVVLDGAFTPASFAAGTRELASTTDHALYTALVPAQLITLLDAAAGDTALRDALRAYEAILIGGQALPAPVRERALDLGARIVRTYGSSETSGGCVYDGVPLEGTTVRVFEGELRIAGPTLATGYLDDETLTAKTFIQSGGTRWYRTGDLGDVIDGRVQVTGRADNVIISGGVNVSLDRVERVVRGIPGLEQAVVVGIDHARWGEASAIVAAVTETVADELLALARLAVAAQIGAPARPAVLLPILEMPQLSSGKPDRAALAAFARGR